MEIVLMIMVFVLGGAVGYLFTQMQQLKVNRISDDEWTQIMTAVDKRVQFNMKKREEFEKQLNELRLDIDENTLTTVKNFKEVAESIKELGTKQKQYTDKRIEFLNNKFFKVVNLDK